ncbi:MAG: endopeptidase La [Eubacterium sp.]|nr:endopeptidase La [Eubacterium sp.]
MEKQIKTMPVIALKGMVILPGMLVHLDIKRDISKKAVDEAMAGEGVVFITNQNDENVELPLYKDLRAVGVVAKIRQVMRLEEDVVRALVSTTDRATLLCLNQNEPYLTGDVDVYETAEITDEVEYEAMCREARQLYEKYLIKNPSVGRSAYDKIQQSKSLGQILDLIMMHIPMSFEMRQCFLECFDLRDRFYYVLNFVGRELDILEERQKFCQAVKTTLEKNQKEYYLREQMRAIRQELGDVGESQADGYRNQADELICSDEVREKIEQEIKRFESLPANSSETSVSQDYIENLLALPWDKMDETPLDLAEAEAILEEDHYGLQKVKERILEFLAVRTLTGNGEAPILCLVGPPGTGKTSIAKSVARALHKEYVRICLGGVRDEAEIRGHRRTYIGAMPGKIIAGLKKAKVKNPLMLLDEIDKVSSDYKGDTSSALLEVLDPEQNQNFADHYIELPVDLSEVVFLCTANTLDTIPGPLLDRMEVLEIAGYTENEKFHIGKQYLIPKQIKKNGLKKSQLVINDKALKTIISEYTREAGVRGLERQIGKICRKTAKLVVEEQQEKVRVSGKNIEEFLGKKKFRPDMANAENEIGIVRGLAWTQVGGDTLEIEVNIMPGEGNLILTGQLGDVMQESARIALSYVRSIVKKEASYFKEHDIHLHVPEGAVPKDGPSAGVTMSTALYSAIEGIPVDAKVAMTGEVTLRGKVLPIGGLKEKLLAAKSAGIKKVLVPQENKPDVEELEEEITDGIQIVFVTKVKQVLKESLVER